jgi:hypothetical protein
MRSTTLLLTFLATFAPPLPALADSEDSRTDEPVSETTVTAAEDATSAESNSRTLAAASYVEPPREQWDVTDVQELPGRTYMFAGIRYRGNVIPGFLLGLFLDESKTIYTSLGGIELDIRKDGFSLIPSLSLHELGTRDILLKQKNTPDIPGNYAIVNSGMKVIYASVDLLWSAKLHKNIELEYGAGFGLGVVFGELMNNWAQESPDGTFVSSTNRRFKRCQTVLPPGVGCNRGDHQNADIDKVGGYMEPSWLDGGSKPVLFPWIAVPQLGLRIKPVKNFVGRIGVGFALTGFWFGLSAQYGFEQKPKE